jgi:cytochrome c553
MKRIVAKSALRLTLLAIAISIAPALAGGDGLAVRNCTWCHGTSGQGYTVAPRLAGQQPAYLMKQIKDLREHTRDNPFSKQYMWGAVAALDFQSARDLAAYFASIPPKPANDGDSSLIAAGKTIYMEGIPEANIAACYACHGPDGVGVRDIPRLGGLAYFYLKARLEQWGQGYHSGEGTPMPVVARELGPKEIEALASYLSFVR